MAGLERIARLGKAGIAPGLKPRRTGMAVRFTARRRRTRRVGVMARTRAMGHAVATARIEPVRRAAEIGARCRCAGVGGPWGAGGATGVAASIGTGRAIKAAAVAGAAVAVKTPGV